VVVFEEKGRNKGCWVMRAEEDGETERQGDGETEHDADKIIVRSNGTVTYTGKDIAYHLWKLGKLGLDFNYQHLRNDHHGHPVWVTTGTSGTSEHPPFGNGTAYMNVIDVGQSYPQANVKRAVMLMAESDEQRAKVARSAHLAYEKVTLSADAARVLGVSGEGSVSMSGRKGLGVKADDLIDRLEANALTEVQARHAELPAEEQRLIAHKIAVAALRYFLLKYTRTSIIAFDFTEALSFTGETGPYILNSVVRAKSIFRKLGQPVEVARAAFNQLTAEQLAAVFSGESGNALWTAVYFAARLDDAIQQASQTLEPNHVVKHTFQLAKQFHLFYESHHILSETDEAKKLTLLMIADLLRRKLELGLSLLGIEVPEKM
jgi:arginyl-tRNA synthetase